MLIITYCYTCVNDHVPNKMRPAKSMCIHDKEGSLKIACGLKGDRAAVKKNFPEI